MKTPLANGSAGGCTSCHTTKSWQALQGFDHDSTAFPLSGAHRAAPCERCHRANGKSFYAATARKCPDCHPNVHGAQFSNSPASECGACHNSEKWKPAAFNHDTQSSFKLEEAHRNLACAQCHKNGTMAGGTVGIIYKPTPTQCAGCHEDVHGGQFSPAACSQCHQTAKWKPSTFDHNTQSAYKLDGAHRNVRCLLCHTNTREVAGKLVLFYKPTPRQCADCHKFEPTGSAP